jgi:hypothetical protein
MSTSAVIFVVLVVLFYVHFLSTFVAHRRRHRQMAAILISAAGYRFLVHLRVG